LCIFFDDVLRVKGTPQSNQEVSPHGTGLPKSPVTMFLQIVMPPFWIDTIVIPLIDEAYNPQDWDWLSLSPWELRVAVRDDWHPICTTALVWSND
jgi:hypothetical protein